MTHSERIFSKPITELTYSDIETYFTESWGETDLIEFKGFDSRKSLELNLPNIHRTFCALLNSQGGIIVWGAPFGSKAEGQKESHFQGELKPLTEVPEKDWLVNKLVDKIIPLPNSFNIVILPNSTNNKSVVIIEVQKSDYAPHQFESTYFMRIDGQTKPAPHHYVEALFKQIKFPQIEGYIKFKRVAISGRSVIMFLEVYLFNFSALQNEENISYILSCVPGKFSNGEFQKKSIPIGILSYGSPNMFEHDLVYTDTEIIQNSGEITFLLQFTGKNSPTKMSEYKLVISPREELNLDQLNTKITYISENKLMSDRQGEMSKNEKLEIILGRPYI